MSSKTLISYDSLQQYSLDKYPTYLSLPRDYFSTIERVKGMDINRIIFSHNYEPCGYSVNGRQNILNCMKICKTATIEKYFL